MAMKRFALLQALHFVCGIVSGFAIPSETLPDDLAERDISPDSQHWANLTISTASIDAQHLPLPSADHATIVPTTALSDNAAAGDGAQVSQDSTSVFTRPITGTGEQTTPPDLGCSTPKPAPASLEPSFRAAIERSRTNLYLLQAPTAQIPQSRFTRASDLEAQGWKLKAGSNEGANVMCGPEKQPEDTKEPWPAGYGIDRSSLKCVYYRRDHLSKDESMRTFMAKRYAQNRYHVDSKGSLEAIDISGDLQWGLRPLPGSNPDPRMTDYLRYSDVTGLIWADKAEHGERSATDLKYIFSGPVSDEDVVYSAMHSIGKTGFPEFEAKAVVTPSDNAEAFLALMGTQAAYVVSNLLGTRRAQFGSRTVESIIVYLQETQDYLPPETPRHRLQADTVNARVSIDFKLSHGAVKLPSTNNATAHALSRQSLQLYTGIQNSMANSSNTHVLCGRPRPNVEDRGLLYKNATETGRSNLKVMLSPIAQVPQAMFDISRPDAVWVDMQWRINP